METLAAFHAIFFMCFLTFVIYSVTLFFCFCLLRVSVAFLPCQGSVESCDGNCRILFFPVRLSRGGGAGGSELANLFRSLMPRMAGCDGIFSYWLFYFLCLFDQKDVRRASAGVAEAR